MDGKNKRRLLYAWNYLSWGGSQVYMLAVMKLAHRQFDVHLIVPEGTDPNFLAFLKDLEVSVHYFTPAYTAVRQSTVSDRFRRRLNKIRSEVAMIRAIDQFAEPNAIVHVDLAPQQAFRSLFKLSRKYKVFTTVHNSMPRHSSVRELLWRLYLRSVTRSPNFRLFAGNRDTKAYLCKYLPKAYSGNIAVTSTAINPEEINAALASDASREQLFRELGISADKVVIMTVGQFIDRKGRWVLLEAARQIASIRDDVVFVWLMPALPDAPTVSRIEEYELGERFVPIASERVGNDRISVLRFVKLADVFVLPSLVEGLPIAMLEAMALGVPTIATRINGIPEAVKDGETGLLVPPGDAIELSRRILELLEDKEVQRRLAKNGREFVLGAFDEREVARTAIGEYLKAC